MTTAPIRKRVDVPLPPDAAFDLFTRDLGRWWPLAHDDAPVTVEPFVGGRILEPGRAAPWATVTDWSPGRRFAALWHMGRDAEEATELAVTFAPLEGGTRVDLTHSGFDRLGAPGETMAARYGRGWERALGARYHAVCHLQAACEGRIEAVFSLPQGADPATWRPPRRR